MCTVGETSSNVSSTWRPCLITCCTLFKLRRWPSLISAVTCLATREAIWWVFPWSDVLVVAALEKLHSISRFETLHRKATSRSPRSELLPPLLSPNRASGPPSCRIHCRTGAANNLSTQQSGRARNWAASSVRCSMVRSLSTSCVKQSGNLWYGFRSLCISCPMVMIMYQNRCNRKSDGGFPQDLSQSNSDSKSQSNWTQMNPVNLCTKYTWILNTWINWIFREPWVTSVTTWLCEQLLLWLWY